MYLMGCFAKVHSYDILKMFCWTKLFFINVTNKFGFIYAIFATIWKLSKYGGFFWSLFSCIQTEHGVYGVNLRIQSNTWKYGPEKTLRWEAFHADATFINTIIESLNYSRLRFFPWNNIGFSISRTLSK